MTRMSKAKHDKLESIMSLVESLGIDRVLGRLRQTKMMSKDVLDDVREWETEYEKRVALLGFLSSPEGKRAFGALSELSQVHEEQLKRKEEEKLRQEQAAQQHPDLRKFNRGKGGGGANANLKMKLRQQLAKRREPPQPNNAAKQEPSQPPPQPRTQQIAIPTPTATKSGKRSPVVPFKAPPKEQEPDKSKVVGETSPEGRVEETAKKKTKEKITSDRKSPSPIQGVTPRSSRAPDAADMGLDLSLTGSAAMPNPPSRPMPTPQTTLVPKPALPESKPPEIVELRPEISPHDGQWGNEESEEDVDASEDDTVEDVPIAEDRHSPDGENQLDDKDDKAKGGPTEGTIVKKVRISDSVTIVEVHDSAPSSPSTTSSTPTLRRRKLNDIHQKLSSEEMTVDMLTMDQIKEIVAEWITLKGHGTEDEIMARELQQVRDDLKRTTDEKDKIRKEKDRYVFKEFELQQKLQDQVQKYKSLKDDHDSLKLGHLQSQQSSRKNSKMNMEMKKKIAKLESKIKSYDKVTVRKGTQTTEVFDRDVHEALRTTEESLQVTQSELKEALAKSKTAQQEAEELKKQLNAKGREINKRERKSKKDEESIRSITRDRDALEAKLRKVSEQLEYYRGILDIRTKGGKRQVPEKKEVRVQRCSSGRHIIVKSHVAQGCHQKDDGSKNQGNKESEETKTSSRGSKTTAANTNTSKQLKQASSKQSLTSSAKSLSEQMKSNTKQSINNSNGSNTSTSTQAQPKPNIEAKIPPNKQVSTPSKDSQDSSKQDKISQPKPMDSEAPAALQSKKSPQTTTPGSAKEVSSAQQNSTGEASPKVGTKQIQSKVTNDKPPRPKAATVRTTSTIKK